MTLRTGLRLGEQIALQWSDIDWHGRFIMVQRNLVRGVLTSTKSHQRRRVDMSTQLFATLLEWRRQQRARWLKKGKPVPEWVFPSLEGTALEERNVRHVFTRMLDKAELRRIRIHDLRHHADSRIMPTGFRYRADRGGDRARRNDAVGIIRGALETRGVGRAGGSGLASRRAASCAPALAL